MDTAPPVSAVGGLDVPVGGLDVPVGGLDVPVGGLDVPVGGLDVPVGVRALAEFLCRKGDIHYRYDAATEGREGIAAQQQLQRDRGPAYERERRVVGRFSAAGVTLKMSGRVDGCDLSERVRVVEEFKASRADLDALHAHMGSAHLAQLTLYAAMLARELGEPGHWCLRLIYCHPDTLATRVCEAVASADELNAFFDATCRRFCTWLATFHAHRHARNHTLSAARFPFDVMRIEQRTLARHTFRVSRDGGALLAEAPTGIGKSLGTLFPALKAMAQAHIDRVLFLTSRGTGQAAAADAVQAITRAGNGLVTGSASAAGGTPLRTITVTARDKICFMPEPVCDPEVCEFARGYYDRRMPAMASLLARGTMSRDVIESVAGDHRVCPFELSLDAAVWSDIVVCDYNYLFDPVVHLKRITGMFSDRTLVLIDEAHQLPDRVRDMLSCELERALVQDLAADVGASPALRRAAAALDRALLALRRAALGGRVRRDQRYALEVTLPDRLATAVDAVVTAMLEQPAASAHRDTARLFQMLRMQRTLSWYAPDGWVALISGTGPAFCLHARCLDPAAHIGAVLRQHHAAIGFSATLTPLALFHRLHGLPKAQTLRVASPFRCNQLGVFIVRDVDPRFRARRRSLDALVALIADVTSARAGNYLVALPSFQYLNLVADAFCERHANLIVQRQHPAMDANEREAFVAGFRGGAAPRLGFVVQGGLFTESVDLPGTALIGMIVVGVGLPPPSVERERLADYFRRGDAQSAGTLARSGRDDAGFLAAYQQPAMTRVVQAAGRLIRSEQDRGVLCLVDDRFLQAQYRRFFPDFWRPIAIRAKTAHSQLDAFWNPG
jgi:DNA excision repair protein ERCC-2